MFILLKLNLFAMLPCPQKLCNFVFIDGGHLAAQLIEDVFNIKHLVDPDNHVVLIDDLQSEELFEAYHLLIDNGVIKENKLYDNMKVSIDRIIRSFNSWIFN
jgi:hypothetical protein